MTQTYPIQSARSICRNTSPQRSAPTASGATRSRSAIVWPPDVIVSVPSGITEVEERAVIQAMMEAGARRVYAADLSTAGKRAELAKQFGADEVIFTDKTDLTSYPFPRGGVDKVLITAPPALIETATHIMNLGGIIAFLGIAYGDAAKVSFDSNVVHHKKIQIRASDAVPALYFPMCIDLVESGMIDVKSLVTQTFPLEKTVEGLKQFCQTPMTSVKAVMVNE